MDKKQRKYKYLLEHPEFNYGNNLYLEHLNYNKQLRYYISQWRKNNPEKIKAHRKIFIEIRAGRLKKENCFCGNEKTEAHHEDYSKPLWVKWLCKKHHIDRHFELKNK